MDGNSHTSGIKRLGIAVIGVALVAVIVAYSFWFGEPRWQGRRLSSWLEEGRWYLFGIYCLVASVVVFGLYRAGY